MTQRFCLFIIVLFISGQVNGQLIRSIDGSNNNTNNPQWGSHDDRLTLLAPPAFVDSIGAMSDYDRPNPRQISNMMFAQPDLISDEQSLSDFVWVFGQFIDHDVILVESDPREPLFITFPEDDPIFPPNARPISMFRSHVMEGTGTDINNPRAYANGITAFIDASTVYGSDEARASWLRTYEAGKLKTSAGNLLPWNTTTGEFNDPSDSGAPFMELAVRPTPKRFFIAGDVRANENPLLAAFHTIFMREHNRLCDVFMAEDPTLSDEDLYQKARRWVSGIIQNIVYDEWLPVMGVHLTEYRGYRDDVNPQISNEFSAAAFRMGHTLINSNILRLQPGGEELAGGSMALRDAFFNPTAISLAGGIDPFLRGMASQVQQKLDCKVIDDVRNFLFGTPEAGGMDLAAININRGRERGLPDYNTLRSELGLPALDAMEEVTDDQEAVDDLIEIYGSVDNIDAWVGMLAEQYMPDAMFGSTIMRIMEEQFERLRDGDRFYFEGDREFSSEDIAVIKGTSFRDVIMRNTDIRIMQDNVFQAMPSSMVPAGPELENRPLAAVAYPNPTQGQTSIRIKADLDFDITVEVYDNTGKMVNTFVHALAEGENDIPLDLSPYGANNLFNVVLRKNVLEYSIVRVTKY